MTTSSFLALGTRRTVVFAYAFTLAFMLCTAILLFHPSGNHLSPSFRSIFLTPSNRSHFSSMFSRFLPQNHHLNSSSSSSFSTSFPSSPMTEEVTSQFSEKKDDGVLKDDKNTSAQFSRKPNETEASNKNNNSLSRPQSSAINEHERVPSEREKTSHQISEKNGNNTSMEMREWNSSRDGDLKAKAKVEEQRKENWLDLMGHCDIYDGKWEKDDSYPLYKPGSCPHIDEPFNCFVNGRPDNGYEKYRWQPNNCNIPRLNGRDMLEKLRGKRLVFVGDSLNRNMWESMVCILRDSVIDKSSVFEVSGREEFRTEGSYSFIFKDYNCSVEFFRSPFLVQECEMPDKNGSMKETLRLDIIEGSSDRYKTADVLVFNTGHWWTHEKTSRGEGYYQEGNHVYGQLHVVKAFRKAMTTWGRWVDANINPSKTQVFFRGYSASHFSGGRWNSGGECDSETEPIKKDKYLTKYPRTMKVLESVMKRMKNPVFYLNITRISDYRKDAHPSIYRKQYLTEEERRSPLQYQDCSHWCLPGLPDTWNELIYAQFLFKHNQDQQQQQQQQQQQKRM